MAAAATPPPVEAFAKLPDFRNPKISPDGRTLALLGIRDFGDFIALFDLDSGAVNPAANFTGLEVTNYWWKGDDMLLLLLENAAGNRHFQTLNLKTKKTKILHSFNNRGGRIVNPLVDDPDHALVSTYTPTGVNLRKLNVRTGKLTTLEDNPGFVIEWLTDRSGRALAALGLVNEEWFMLTRTTPESKWQKIDLGRRAKPDFWPMAVHHDQRRIIGWDYKTSDTARVVVRDPASGADEVVSHSDKVDPSYNVVWSDDDTRVRAIAYEFDRPSFHYFDPADAAIAASIDAALPDSTNTIVSTSADERRLVIESISDRQPERYTILDRNTGRLTGLGVTRPGLVGMRFGESRYFTFAARDGLKLSARIFLPEGRNGPHPLIVYCDADLNARAHRFFYTHLMLLTSRGYAVLWVNKRGVEGFGETIAEAGRKSLDTLMADDLAAAVEAAEAQGWVKTPHAALLGAHAGGVLALYTYARHPEKFSAWINFNTPMKRGGLDSTDLTFGLVQNRGRFISPSRENAFDDYRLSLAPLKLIPSIKIPSFHYYGSQAYLNLDGDKLKKSLGDNPAPFQFLTGLEWRKWSNDLEKRRQQTAEEFTRIWQELLVFLEQHFPSASPLVSSTPTTGGD